MKRRELKCAVLFSLVAFSAVYASPFPAAYDAHVLEYNGHWYAWTSDHGDWEAAKEDAESVGGYLATINDGAENTALADFIVGSYRRDQGSSNSVAWIGLWREAVQWTNPEDGWQWINGEDITYENYSQLVGVGADETHMYLMGADHGSDPYEWANNPAHDTVWNLNLRGIIEIPEPATLSLLALGGLGLLRRRKKQ